MESIYTFTNSPIIVTDLDGTILTNGNVSSEIFTIFNKLHKLGVPVTFATGRSKIPASKFAKLLNLKLPYICSGGSIISDPETEVDLYQKEIDDDTFKNIINDVNEFKNLNTALYSLENIYVQNEFMLERYLRFDLFFTMQVNNLRIFLKMNHFNKFDSFDGYFVTPYYPAQKKVLDLGVRWYFFN